MDVGDRIVTGANGQRRHRAQRSEPARAGPDSSITLDEFTITGGAPSTRVSLFSGVLRSLVNASSGGAPANYQVHTPNAVAAVRGTKFDTAYTENTIRSGYQGCERYTDVSVYQGTVNLAPIATPNAGEDISSGYEATAAVRQASDDSRTAGDDRCNLARQRERRRGLFTGTVPGSSGAPPPACPVTVCPACKTPVGRHMSVGELDRGGGETW